MVLKDNGADGDSSSDRLGSKLGRNFRAKSPHNHFIGCCIAQNL